MILSAAAIATSSFRIDDCSAVAHARRTLVRLADEHGFVEEDAGRVALIATEIGSNLIKHGGGGELLVRLLWCEGRKGLELIGLDQGRGMADLAKCLRDGYPSSDSAGTGLGAIKRASQHFEVHTRPGQGTAVLSQLWPGLGAPPPQRLQIGAVVVPKPGETLCGDAWCVSERSGGALLLGVDGLGHGPAAAEAASTACAVFEAHRHQAPAQLLSTLHGALRATRGAAVALVDIDWMRGRVVTVAVGNLVVAIVDEQRVRRVASDNGIVGHVLPRIRELQYDCEPGSVLLMHTDGVGTGWQSPWSVGLLSHHPSLIAAVLYRDHRRGHDDALVVAMKRSHA